MRPAALLLALAAAPPAAAQSDEAQALDFFEARVRPVLSEHCYECHGPAVKNPKGGLRLDSPAGWRAGGDTGPAIVPGDPEASLLVRAVRYTDELLQMPPDGKLPDALIADLTAWVAMGAPDARVADAPAPAPARAQLDWSAAREHWAYRPVRRVDPPPVRDGAWPRNSLDRFVLARLEALGLRPSPEADKETLLRRASFDLLGLPPSAEERAAFLADEEQGAFERLIDRLLASPHYGERWGRRWLDLARYADSNGLDENLALANAWRYRDWVVAAVNGDMPYDAFVTAQLAGDLLPSTGDERADLERLVATGFLALGPKMLAEQDKDKLVIDVVDEQIDVATKAFLGLTVSCARCHDHKFDAVPTEDYYALAGVFKSTSTLENLDHVSRWRETPLATRAELAAAEAWEQARAASAEAAGALAARADAELSGAWPGLVSAYLLAGAEAARAARFVEAEDFARGNLRADAESWGSPEAVIVHTAEPGLQWVEYDLPAEAAGFQRLSARVASAEARPVRVLLDGVLVAGESLGGATGSFKPDGLAWTDAAVLAVRPGGSVLRLERDGPVPHVDKLLFVPLAAADAPADWPRAPAGLAPELVRSFAEYLERTRRTGDPLMLVWHRFAALPAEGFAAAAAELVAALRAARAAGVLPASPLALSVLEGLPPESLRELAGRYQVLFSLADRAWRERPAGAATLADPELDVAARVLHGPLGSGSPFALHPAAREALYPADLAEGLTAERARLSALEAEKPAPFAHALAVRDAEAPADVPVHVRGSHLALAAAPVPRGALRVTDHLVMPPAIPAGASGRLELARWISDPAHPLTARVAANRLWQGHFGEGLVRTPSNFGTRGEPPTHPELLDWLALELIEGGWSQKALHRMIMTSAAYRQSSAHDAVAAERDPENRLLWRMNRRRLDAESVRDALLSTAGRLDPTLGGTLLETPDREYVTNDQSKDLARYDAPRRSLYLPIIRNAIYDLFAAFDYSDPSVPVDRRPSTTVAHQALVFMNGSLVLQSAAAVAEAALASAPEDPERVAAAYRRVLGRAPSAEETARALAFVAEARGMLGVRPGTALEQAGTEHVALEAAGQRMEDPGPPPPAAAPDLRAFAGLCQVLLSSNEFLHVD